MTCCLETGLDERICPCGAFHDRLGEQPEANRISCSIPTGGLSATAVGGARGAGENLSQPVRPGLARFSAPFHASEVARV